jgi:tetratricopeptide (TPR) repeat protein
MLASAVRLSLVAVLLAAFAPPPARADTVHLKNGKSLDGEVIREDHEWVVVRVPFGEIKLRAVDVEAVERQTPLEYRLTLGRKWLRQRDYERAVKVLEEAYLANKDDNDARRMLATSYDQYGSHLLKVRRLVEARNYYDSLLKLDPDGKLIGHHAKDQLRSIASEESSAEAMLQEARRKAQQRQWARAIELYENALAYTPDVRETVAQEVAICYVQQAQLHANDGALVSAAGDLEAAMQNNPALADRLETSYVACALPNILAALSRGDVNTARVDLARVLKYAPTNRGAMYVNGRMFESLGDLPLAVEQYAHALRTRPASATPEHVAELRQRLETTLNIKADRIQIDTTFAELTGYAKSSDGPALTLETENFTIVHYNDALAREVAGRAESERLRIMNDLKLKPFSKKTRIIIHRTQAEYTARTAQPEWTGGYTKFFFEGTNVTQLEIHSWQTSQRLLTSVLPHEITHVLVAANARNSAGLPRCLHEGIAVLEEPQFRHTYMLNFLKVRLKSQEFVPLSDLLTMRDYPRDPEFFYAEGYALVQFLVNQRGSDVVGALIGTIQSPEMAAVEVLKASGAPNMEALDEQWKKWILSIEQ